MKSKLTSKQAVKNIRKGIKDGITVTTVTFDIKTKEILLGKRNSHDRFEPNYWCLPGGKFEKDADKTVIDAGKREIEEEIKGLKKLSFKDKDMVLEMKFPHPKKGKLDIYLVPIFVAADKDKSNAEPNDDPGNSWPLSDTKWLPLEAILKERKLFSPSRELLEQKQEEIIQIIDEITSKR